MSAFKDWLTGLTSKTTPVDADELYLRDSSGTPGSKKLTWANLKATLLTYFDTAYLKLTGGTLAGGTVTASSPVLTTTQTWNNAGVTFTGILANFTDMASAAGSRLMDLQVNGVSRLNFGKDAYLGSSLGQYDKAGWITSGNPYGSLEFGVSNSVQLSVYSASIAANGVPIVADWGGFFELNADSGVTNIVRLYRDGHGTLAQRNGTNAQTYRNYGTYTDASNYRRVAIAMTTAGVASITPEGAGTGASGNVLHISGLPTSNPGAGILWNDSGTVKVGT